MAKRQRLSEDNGSQSLYFTSDKPNIQFIHTGCHLLNCVLGGGYPLGRVVNIVGDKSTGKTLLAIEACANFKRQYPNGIIFYNEAEAAFDEGYAEALGMPVNDIEFSEDCFTVEDVFEELEHVLKTTDDKTPGLYILDSLDALSDRAEQKRDIDEGTYGAQKAKKMSELFRRLVKDLGKKNICTMVISQVRDDIGATFGRKVKRSGGRAMDFYASQVLYLAHLGYIHKTRRKIKRPVGVKIKAKCDKNKVSMPFRECEFQIRFGFGVDDVRASVDWLKEIGRLQDANLKESELKEFLAETDQMDGPAYMQRANELGEIVKTIWYDTESDFIEQRRKY